jgi:hypothetical protein
MNGHCGLARPAYPANHGAGVITTLTVNGGGILWQRDLRKDTARAVAAIKQCNSDDGWTPLGTEG